MAKRKVEVEGKLPREAAQIVERSKKALNTLVAVANAAPLTKKEYQQAKAALKVLTGMAGRFCAMVEAIHYMTSLQRAQKTAKENGSSHKKAKV